MDIAQYSPQNAAAGDEPGASTEAQRPKGGIVAAFLGASATVASIGAFQLIAHASTGFKNFLKLSEGVGPLSGKVVFGYLLGFVVFLISYAILRKRQKANLAFWLMLLFITLLAGSLFTFAPFVELVSPE